MKKIIYPLFISLLLFNNFSLASEKNIAFIDINSIFINSDAGKDLNSFLKQKKKDLDDQVNISVNEINNKKDTTIFLFIYLLLWWFVIIY